MSRWCPKGRWGWCPRWRRRWRWWWRWQSGVRGRQLGYQPQHQLLLGRDLFAAQILQHIQIQIQIQIQKQIQMQKLATASATTWQWFLCFFVIPVFFLVRNLCQANSFLIALKYIYDDGAWVCLVSYSSGLQETWDIFWSGIRKIKMIMYWNDADDAERGY